MRLGGPVLTDYEGPDAWVAALRQRGYSAAYCPVEASADDATVRAYEKAARAADIVIAEVGAWSNPLSPDPETRRAALARCKEQLHLADRIGARCCVNIAGSRGPSWHGPHADDLTEATFGLIVETVREIIDEVEPSRTYYTLETMPWLYPDSPDSYLSLLEAIDRDRFAVHLDPANLVCSPQRYFHTGRLLRECFDKLGPFVRSCHAKDVVLADRFMVHLDEVRPGLGNLDYVTFLRELSRLPADTPLMLEHLATEEEYRAAADHIRSLAAAHNLALHP
ncbi:MAG: sugar phosphate isomerase/epimerase [Anaerolineae bacterium]|nr:sugar phosphate isomerase/epimerase [Anaerolineae bacterium]